MTIVIASGVSVRCEQGYVVGGWRGATSRVLLLTFQITIINDSLYEDYFVLKNTPISCKFLFDFSRISLII